MIDSEDLLELTIAILMTPEVVILLLINDKLIKLLQFDNK